MVDYHEEFDFDFLRNHGALDLIAEALQVRLAFKPVGYSGALSQVLMLYCVVAECGACD